MAGDFDIKINIKTVLDGQNGLLTILQQLLDLQKAIQTVQAEAAANGGIVSPEALAGVNNALTALVTTVGESATAAAEEAAQAAINAAEEAAAAIGGITGEVGDSADEAAEQTGDAALKASEEAVKAAEEAAKAAEEAAGLMGEAYVAGLEGLDEELQKIAEDGGIEIFDLSGAFDSLKGAIMGALGALTAYASFSGLKGLTESIIATGADFEQTMLQVKAVTGATDEQFERMS
ncbi:MAG: hypothetical protein LBR80_06930, partial [Deltaproteobacteria bacterium]|nr:hypothetical protein [Deltaproteobacteria bacterium]